MDVDQITRLHQAGADYILVPDLPDMGKTPSSMLVGIQVVGTLLQRSDETIKKAITAAVQKLRAGDEKGATQAAATVLTTVPLVIEKAQETVSYGFTELAQSYNQQLEASLGGAGFSIIPLDVRTMVNEVLADPKPYGFDNVMAPACNTASALECTTATADDSQRYFFADQVHPTPAAHAILAQYAASVIEAPQLISELPQVVVSNGLKRVRSLDRHMRLARSEGKTNTFNIFASGGYTSLELGADSAIPPTKSDNIDFTIGADWHLTDNILLGAAFGHSKLKPRFGDGRGGFTAYDNLFMLYASGGIANAYVNATAGYGLLDFNDIDRNITLGDASRHEKGNAHGDQLLLRLSGGYDFHWQALTTGPTIGLTYQHVHVNSYREQEDRSTSMHFGSQNLNSLMGSLGWRVDYDVGETVTGRLRPYASATYLHEFRSNQDRVVLAGLNTFGPDFTMPAYQPDRNYSVIGIGLDDDVGRNTTASLDLSTTLGQTGGHQSSVALTLNHRF